MKGLDFMKKSIAVFTIVVILIASVFCFSVSASSDIIIDSADIEAVVNTDGTVDITEKWNVEYPTTGEGFTRWIDLYDSSNSNELSELEKFDSISNVSVKIDGNPIEQSQTGVNTFRTGNSADGKSFNIVINAPSALVTKEYTISYTVNGAVKKIGNDAEFAFVFIGKSFEVVSNNVSVKVYFPEESQSSLYDFSTGLINGNCVDYLPGRVYDTFRVNVKCDSDVFEQDSLVKYSAFANGLKVFVNKTLDALYWIFIAVVIILVVILALFSDRFKRKSIEKCIKQDYSEQEKNEITHLPENLTPCTAYKMLMPYSRISPKSTSKKVPVLFVAAIIECASKGYIVQQDDTLIVGTPTGDVPEYILSVLNFLKTFSEKKDNRYVINSKFGDNVRNECMSSYDVITNYLGTFYNLIPSFDSKDLRSQENKTLYSKAFILKENIEKNKNKTTFSDCMRKAITESDNSDKDVFSLMFVSGSADKVFADNENDCISSLAVAISAMYDVFIKSK